MKISLLPPDTTLALTDVFPAVSDAQTKRITLQTLIDTMTPYVLANFDGWQAINSTLSVATGYNKGQKEFVLDSTADLTGKLPVGSKLKIGRSTVAPTQCMSFTAANSQYAQKTSPTGYSFSSTATVEAWIYLNSYGGSADQAIISRYDGTNGWILHLTPTGQIRLNTNPGGTNKLATSNQCVPLKRMVQIAAVYNAGTITIYMNGAPLLTTVSGTGTAITQGTGAVQIAAYSSTAFFDGLISEARVWSTARTATQILDNMAISLTGAESGLVGLWQGSGNFNDKTSNANHLTAAGTPSAATATQISNPYNTTEYAVVTKVTTTQVTVFTGTDCTIPNMALNSPYFSSQRAPFGFPSGRGKWRVDALYATLLSSGNLGAWQSLPPQLLVPTGDFLAGYQGNIEFNSSAAQTQLVLYVTLSTAAGTESDRRFSQFNQQVLTSGTSTAVTNPAKMENPVSATTPTTYYFNAKATNTAGTIYIRGDYSIMSIYAECAYI